MRKNLILFFLILSMQSYGQASDFNKLLEKYGEVDNELDSNLIRKYFDLSLDPIHAPSGYADKIIFRKSNMIGLTCKIECTAGGICEYSDLRIFDYKGNVLGKLKQFEFCFADCQDHNNRFCSYESDTILILVNEEIKRDCYTDSTIRNQISYEIYLINSEGNIARNNIKYVDTRRDYYIASINLLKASDIEKMTKSNLAIMRNEIFAAHGYIFKTKKWNEFFSALNWYTPKFDNVDDYLTIIERENIKLIQKYERQIQF